MSTDPVKIPIERQIERLLETKRGLGRWQDRKIVEGRVKAEHAARVQSELHACVGSLQFLRDNADWIVPIWKQRQAEKHRDELAAVELHPSVAGILDAFPGTQIVAVSDRLQSPDVGEGLHREAAT